MRECSPCSFAPQTPSQEKNPPNCVTQFTRPAEPERAAQCSEFSSRNLKADLARFSGCWTLFASSQHSQQQTTHGDQCQCSQGLARCQQPDSLSPLSWSVADCTECFRQPCRRALDRFQL